ncbi:MAG: molybdopterin oxidoreductase family protein, partial [Alphaproteobacteria bacterium]
CALDVERIDSHHIGRVHGSRRNSYTAGVVCAKVARYAERVHHPDRLRAPLRRVGEKGVGRAAFAPIGWDDALDIIAEKLIRIADTDGSEAVWPYYYAGTMGFVQRDGIERLRHVMRYSRQYNTICVALADGGWVAGVGQKRGVDSREVVESDLIVVWGGNPVSTQVNLMSHIARARKTRGAKLVVIDPYRTPTAEGADLHLPVRPGTDGALACAVMHVLFKEGFADRAYMAKYTDVPEELAQHLSTRTPEWASAITGLPAADITAFARLYGATKRSYIRVGYGFSRTRNGSAQLHAVSCLPAVTGAWQYKGGGAMYGQSGLYQLDRSMIMGLDAMDPSIRRLDQSRMGPILTGDPRDIGAGPPVKALFIQNTNPVVVCPESAKVRQGFMREDLFVAVHEQFMTDTAAMADIVLPATTFLEHDDFYTASGHTHLQVAKKVIEPLEGTRSNHDVICALAKRLGAEHPGFRMTAWELIDSMLKASKLPDAGTLHGMGGIDMAPDFETAHFLNGFPTPDGRFHFRPDWSVIGSEYAAMPPLPDHMAVIDEASSAKPFRLVTAPARSYLNTSFTETPGSIAREGRPTAFIHPADCTAMGLAKGDRVRVGNDRGSIVVHAEPREGQQRGVIVIESIWPNTAFEEGIGVNTLVSADPGYPAGGAVFHDTAVWLKAA